MRSHGMDPNPSVLGKLVTTRISEYQQKVSQDGQHYLEGSGSRNDFE